MMSDQIGAYDQLDLEFAQMVAAQIAVAVEAQCYQQQLASDRDRYELLLEMSNMLISNLNLRELLSAISVCLRKVLPHDSCCPRAVRSCDQCAAPHGTSFPRARECLY